MTRIIQSTKRFMRRIKTRYSEFVSAIELSALGF